MHASHASPPNATVPFTQYSVAHCDSHIPLGPQAHALMSITRVPMPAVCASWQQVLHALAVDSAAHLWFCAAFALPLPEVLPPPEPLELPEVPPPVLPVLPVLLPVVPTGLPVELPAVPPEPLPLLMTRELLLLGVLPEQPLA